MRMTAEELIRRLGLEPLPVEGGYFSQTYCSDENLPASALPARYRGARPIGTAIYYLLTVEPDCFSAMHKLRTDEIYHFYLGDPVEMLLLHPGGKGERVTLGPDVPGGQRVQFVAPRDVWQGSRVMDGGSFALLGATMAPGFAPEDFEAGKRDVLTRDFPKHAELIRKLTRE